ncbi:MAG TPA: DUF4424 family protein [Methylocella sp.]|nr:DUF4424 family protein [Methylocella sp.]
MRVRNGALATTALVLAGAIGAAPAGANHSTAEIAISGLTLTKTDVISMDSEDLYISPSSVRVIYRSTNTTDEPTNVLVAFPLPASAVIEGSGADFWSDPLALKFKTSVDGQPFALQFIKQAFLNGEDVSARLSALHIPTLLP